MLSTIEVERLKKTACFKTCWRISIIIQTSIKPTLNDSAKLKAPPPIVDRYTLTKRIQIHIRMYESMHAYI